MDVFPKFIIETDEDGDYMIIAKCTFHRQLASNEDRVKGGGSWNLNHELKQFTLSGKSHEFGPCEIRDIATCVQNKRVYSSSAMYRNFSDFSFKFYESGKGLIDLDNFKL